MNSFAFVALFAFLAVANAGVVVPSARYVQSPSSSTTVVGPDGSSISSVNAGAKILEHDGVGVVAAAPLISSAPALATYAAPYAAYSAPVYTAHTAYAAPAVVAHSAYTAPVVSAYSFPVVSAYSAPLLSAYSAPVVSAYSAPVVAHSGVVDSTVISGPSGTVSTSKTVAGPAVVAAY